VEERPYRTHPPPPRKRKRERTTPGCQTAADGAKEGSSPRARRVNAGLETGLTNLNRRALEFQRGKVPGAKDRIKLVMKRFKWVLVGEAGVQRSRKLSKRGHTKYRKQIETAPDTGREGGTEGWYNV